MIRSRSQRTARRSRGVVLIVVLVVIVVLSLAAYSFTDLMQSHRRAAVLSGKQIQARLLVDSGVETIKLYLTSDESTRSGMGGHYNNPSYFQAAKVIPELDALSRGSFSVLAPLIDKQSTQAGVRYGLEDESTRLNLNLLLLADKLKSGAARTFLMALPNMTEDVADAILDWIDEDDETREYGAEVDYYSGLSPAYGPRNGPPETIEELLLVRGVTPQLLFGIDSNRNGMPDAHEVSNSNMGIGTSLSTPTSSATTMDSSGFQRGWAAYMTLYSAERNARADGSPRIWLNNTDLTQLQTDLKEVFNEEWTNFILAYRLYGAYTGTETGQSAAGIELDLKQQPKGTFSQVLDLIGKKVQVTPTGGQRIVLQSPFDSAPLAMGVYLPQLMENCTANESTSIPGRININQAPLEILLGIPGMTEDIANEIVSRRTAESSADNENRNYETWLLAEAIVTMDEMRVLTPFITAGGDVFRAQIVGYFQGGGPSARVEVVFDATGTAPRLLFWRDMSHLGRGYALETLGVDLIEQAQ